MFIFNLDRDTLHRVLSCTCSARDLQKLSATCRQSRELVDAFMTHLIEHYRNRYRHLFECIGAKKSVKAMYSTVCQPQIVILGGSFTDRQCDKFSPISQVGQFSKCCSLAGKRGDESEIVLHNGFLFAISGRDIGSLRTVECYNVLSDVWMPGPSLPQSVVAVSAASLEGRLYVIGGFNSFTNVRQSSIFVLEQAVFESVLLNGSEVPDDTAAWTPGSAQLCVGRSHHASVAYRNRIWVAGGALEGHTMVFNTVEVFDPATQQVVPAPPMLKARLKPGLVVIKDVLYAVGGDVDRWRSTHDTIERFDCVLSKWQLVTHYAEKRTGAAVCSCEDRIYVFGGRDGARRHLTWDCYDVTKQEWASVEHKNSQQLKRFALPSFRAQGLVSALAVTLKL